MNLFEELRQRRVPQYLSAYIVGGWGLLQFVTFLESRLLFSPHVVNVVALAMALLLPSVILLAWRHGRPGRDSWGRAEKVSIPVNAVVAALVLLVLFRSTDLGAVTRTVEVADEHGAVTERVVPKREFRRRALMHYLENRGDKADDWVRQGLPVMVTVDLNQDPFVDVQTPAKMVTALTAAGHPDGLDLPRALQRKLARDAHYAYFMAGWFEHIDGIWHVTLELHESDRGRMVATRTHVGADLLALADATSLQLRRDLEVPEGHLDTQEDLPVAEILSSDLEAVEGFVAGLMMVLHDNDWLEAAPVLMAAVARDPGFALGQFLLYVVHTTNGDQAAALAAMDAAMANLYRTPERTRFQIKSAYYYNVKEEPDKAMAVLKMWSQLYPDDVAAYLQQATYFVIRDDIQAAIVALEKVLAIDPTQHQYLLQVADLYEELGDFEVAEENLRHYAELYPGSALSYTALADLHEGMGRFDEARAELEQAQLIEPEQPQIALDLAMIDLRLGDMDSARRACDAVLADAKTIQDSISALDNLRRVDAAQGRIELALEHLEIWHALGLRSFNPVQVEAQYVIMLAGFAESGQAETVLTRLGAARQTLGSPNDQLVGMCEAAALIPLGRFDEAAAGLDETAALLDRFKIEVLRPKLIHRQGQLAEARGDLAAARDLYRTALDHDPAVTRFGRALGRVLGEMGELDEAQAVLVQMLVLEPGQPLANLYLAQLHELAGRTESAREHLDRSLAAWREADAAYMPAQAASAMAARLATTP